MREEMFWHPISEIPPMHEERVKIGSKTHKFVVSDWLLVRDITCHDNGDDLFAPPMRVSRIYKDGGGLFDEWNDQRDAVTHWMPLPEPLEKERQA